MVRKTVGKNKILLMFIAVKSCVLCSLIGVYGISRLFSIRSDLASTTMEKRENSTNDKQFVIGYLV